MGNCISRRKAIPAPLKVSKIVTSSRLREILVSGLVKNNGESANFVLGDSSYCLLPLASVKEWVSSSYNTEGLTYWQEKFDCDDYTLRAVAENHLWFSRATDSSVKVGSAFGGCFGMIEGSSHALCWFVDEEERLHLMEPQNGKIFDIPEGCHFNFAFV